MIPKYVQVLVIPEIDINFLILSIKILLFIWFPFICGSIIEAILYIAKCQRWHGTDCKSNTARYPNPKLHKRHAEWPLQIDNIFRRRNLACDQWTDDDGPPKRFRYGPQIGSRMATIYRSVADVSLRDLEQAPRLLINARMHRRSRLRLVKFKCVPRTEVIRETNFLMNLSNMVLLQVNSSTCILTPEQLGMG